MPKKRKGASLERLTRKAAAMRNARAQRTEAQQQQDNANTRVSMARLRQAESEETRAERNEQRRLQLRQARRFKVNRHRANEQQRQQTRFVKSEVNIGNLDSELTIMDEVKKEVDYPTDYSEYNEIEFNIKTEESSLAYFNEIECNIKTEESNSAHFKEIECNIKTEESNSAHEELEPPACVTLPVPDIDFYDEELHDTQVSGSCQSDYESNVENNFFMGSSSTYYLHNQPTCSFGEIFVQNRNKSISNPTTNSSVSSLNLQSEDSFSIRSKLEMERAKQKVELHIQEVRRHKKLREMQHKAVLKPKLVAVLPISEEVRKTIESLNVIVVDKSSSELLLQSKPPVIRNPEYVQWVRKERERVEQHILEVRAKRKLGSLHCPVITKAQKVNTKNQQN